LSYNAFRAGGSPADDRYVDQAADARKTDAMSSHISAPTIEPASRPLEARGTAHPLPPADIRRNYRLGVINGVLFALGDSLSSAGLVLALLVRQLGGSLALVGLLPALLSDGFLLPQLLVGGRLQAMPMGGTLWLAVVVYSRAANDRPSKTSVLLSWLEHELENADIRIALEQAAAAMGAQWEVWQDGFYLRRLRNWAKVAVEPFPGHHETISVIPDDYCVLLGQHGRGHFIIEHDRSNETTKRWKRKILAYKAFVLSGQFHTRYNIKGSETPLRILTTTPSPERAKNLKVMAETFGPSEAARLFLFAPLREVVSQNALTSPIWLRASSSNHEAIL
jgi:Replication-relaxation